MTDKKDSNMLLFPNERMILQTCFIQTQIALMDWRSGIVISKDGIEHNISFKEAKEKMATFVDLMDTVIKEAVKTQAMRKSEVFKWQVADDSSSCFRIDGKDKSIDLPDFFNGLYFVPRYQWEVYQSIHDGVMRVYKDAGNKSDHHVFDWIMGGVQMMRNCWELWHDPKTGFRTYYQVPDVK